MRVESEDIDRATLAKNGVGDLDGPLPAEPLQHVDHPSNKAGMVLVEGAVKLTAPPAELELGAGFESCQDLAEGAHSQGVEMTALKRRDRRLRDMARGTEVRLSPASSSAERANDEPNSPVVHSMMVGGAAYRTGIWPVLAD